jgi:putative ABC transport system permease protein
MKNGLQSVKARFGADLMAVPIGYDEKAEGILLKGEPSYFYFDKSVEEQIKQVEGVKSVSSQFFLTSSNQDCCDVDVQFIGFDPETDFSVQPWIAESYGGNISDGDIIIGSDITYDGNGYMKFYGRQYKVAARLDETGTGLDAAVYGNINTIEDIFSAAKEQGFAFTENIDPENTISSVLVKTEDGFDTDTVAHNIRTKIDGLQIVKTKSMITGIAESLGNFTAFIYVFSAMFFVAATVTLTIVFSVTVNERKKEFAVLRSIGATGRDLARLVLTESLVISGLGGLTGILFSALVVFSFNTYIGEKIGLPYLTPNISVILLSALLTLAVSLLTGTLSSIYSAAKISGREVYTVMREGEC